MYLDDFKIQIEENRKWTEKHYILYWFKNIFWHIRRFISDIKYYPLYIKRFFQRGFRGYDDTCYWDLGSHLAEYILPKLKHFKENTHTYPGTKEASTPEKWNKTLDKMVYSFERVVEDDFLGYWNEDKNYYVSYSDKKQKEIQKRYEEGMKLFAEYFRAMWD